VTRREAIREFIGENAYLISWRGAVGVRSHEIDHGRSYGDVVIQRNGTRHRREHRWNVVRVLPRLGTFITINVIIRHIYKVIEER